MYRGGKDLLEALDGAQGDGDVSRGRGRPRHIVFGAIQASPGEGAGAYNLEFFLSFASVHQLEFLLRFSSVVLGADGEDFDYR